MHERFNFIDLANAQNSNRIFLDLSFQSEERWNDKQRQKFIKSVLADRCPTPIVLAVVDSCMEYCAKHFGEDSEAYQYFKDKHDRNFKYISIDGNNRTRAIAAFVLDKFSLTMEEHKIPNIAQDHYRVWKPNRDQRKWSKLPQFVRAYMESDNCKVLGFLVKETGLDDLHDLFLSINDGVTLNQQEKRNAIVCDLAKEIRSISNDKTNIPFFENYWTKQSMSRRNHEEWLVSNFVHVTRTGNINKVERDNAYDNRSTEIDNAGLVREVIGQMVDMCLSHDTQKKKLLPNEATLHDFFEFLHWLNKNNYHIKNRRKLFQWFVLTYNTAKTAKDENGSPIIIWTDQNGSNARDYAGCQRSYDGTQREARLGVYTVLGGHHKIYGDRLPKLDDDVLTQKDSVRDFPPTMRVPLWDRQNGICPLSGIKIPFDSIMDGKLYQIDHIIPHAEGGQTTFENAQLVCKDENRNKSDDFPTASL
tara:strand:- start:60 stop:1484 length:1425 start_codon:yes stop_codon:yes gene_type:complete